MAPRVTVHISSKTHQYIGTKKGDDKKKRTSCGFVLVTRIGRYTRITLGKTMPIRGRRTSVRGPLIYIQTQHQKQDSREVKYHKTRYRGETRAA